MSQCSTAAPVNKTGKAGASPPDEDEAALAWGSAAIGKIIGRSPLQVQKLYAAGFFGDAVWKYGHRSMVGNIARLRNLSKNI
jgi:hypothetical protein